MIVCARCGTESPEGFRFCPGCGAALEEAPAPRQSRKVVTALFCDVTGSTALGEELDPEVLRGVMNRYFAEIRATIERHGGEVHRGCGDGRVRGSASARGRCAAGGAGCLRDPRAVTRGRCERGSA